MSISSGHEPTVRYFVSCLLCYLSVAKRFWDLDTGSNPDRSLSEKNSNFLRLTSNDNFNNSASFIDFTNSKYFMY